VKLDFLLDGVMVLFFAAIVCGGGNECGVTYGVKAGVTDGILKAGMYYRR
jgi:hypothetical protein